MTNIIQLVLFIPKLWYMVWLIIVIVIRVLLSWLLISPLIVKVDTRIPEARLRWWSVGEANIWYKDEWWLQWRILFYKKEIRFSEIGSKTKTPKQAASKKRSGRKMKINKILKKGMRIMRTFKVEEWQLAVDTGDHTRNAQLYPLNFIPYNFQHLSINFNDENYLVLKTRNRPWKMLYAFLK
jgi:hypothetical protein